MKLRLLIAALAAVLVALTVGTSPAKATLNCGAPGYMYAGYYPPLTPIGGTYSVRITAVSDALNSFGHVAGWAGVAEFSGGNVLDSLQAGILREYGGSQSLYIEYKPLGQPYQRVYQAPASYGVAYQVSVYHVGSGSWRVTVNGVSYTGAVSANSEYVGGESLNSNTTCNDYSYRFSVSSLSTSSMSGGGNPPYFLSGVTTYGWYSGDVLPPCTGCTSPLP